MKKRIVVTGTGIVTALGTGAEINKSSLLAGRSAVGEIRAFAAGRYPGTMGGEAKAFEAARLFRIDGKRLDRATHLLIEAAREALHEAGISKPDRDTRILVSLGTTLGGMISGEMFHREVVESGLRRAHLSLLDDYLAESQALNLLREFKISGDFIIFSNACASGTNAIGHAFKALQAGEYDIAICGGFDTLSEFAFAGFNSLMAVTPTLCRPFDKKRDGLVLGEGAGILILEDIDRALARGASITGEIKGYGESSDAYHMTSPDPEGRGAAAAIGAALDDAGLDTVDYINAHGTGTPLNDIMESKAIRIAFGKEAMDIPVSSIKPMIGHLLGAAGAVEAIASLFAIKEKAIPPNINFDTPDPDCPLNIVSLPQMKSDIRDVLSNSFGFGGSNAAILLGEY